MSAPAETRVAALYVETNGVYYGLDDVDPWDEARDARLYAGPWPVVAHPPCARWCRLAGFVEARTNGRLKRGEDGGCFAAALEAVRTFGGVLEHPAYSEAWRTFDLPRPVRYGWTTRMGDEGMTTSVNLAAYGHAATKGTWLYAVRVRPATLDWREAKGMKMVSDLGSGGSRHRGDEWREHSEGIQYDNASRTPPAFRDVLLDMARSAGQVHA